MLDLKHYTKQAKRMSLDSLKYAVSDIKECWRVNPEFEQGKTEYSKKLWAEWDAYTVEIQNRRKV